MTMTTAHETHETEITADPKVPVVRIVREFDAPVAKVFRAHSDGDLIAKWLGPRHGVMRVEHYDCQRGGSWRYVFSHDDVDFRFYGSFHEVRSGELIVQTFTWEGEPDGVALERVTFEDLGGGRTRLVATSVVDSFEARDAILASGMEVGVVEGYEKLDELLATM